MNAKGKVIATDLDGTLFYPKRRITMIPKKNILFLRHFIDQGGRVLLVSGRNLDYLNKVKRKLNRPVDVAGCNGAFVKVNDTFIKQSYMNNQRLLTDLNKMKEMFHFPGIFIMSKEYNFVVPKRVFGLSNRIAFFMYQFYQGVYQEKTTRNDQLVKEAISHASVYKLMLFFGSSKKKQEKCYLAMKKMEKLYPYYHFAYNGPSIEMSNIDATKGLAVKQYLDYLKIKHDNVMVVGDSGNDLSMLKAFTHSFTMKHASGEVKLVAKNVISRLHELEKYL